MYPNAKIVRQLCVWVNPLKNIYMLLYQRTKIFGGVSETYTNKSGNKRNRWQEDWVTDREVEDGFGWIGENAGLGLFAFYKKEKEKGHVLDFSETGRIQKEGEG